MATTTLLQVLLGANAAAMLVLAAIYLVKKRLPWPESLFWGLVALFPFLGPFLVIILRPGRKKRRYRLIRGCVIRG